MDFSSARVTAPSVSAVGTPDGNTLFPLNAGKKTGMYRLPDRNNPVLPLPRQTGEALPLNRRPEALPLKSTASAGTLETDNAKLRKAAEGFEAIFIRQLLKTMRTSLQNGNSYGGGPSGEIYADMVESSLAESMAHQSRFGIANTIYNRMVRNIEKHEIALRDTVSSQGMPQDGDR